MKTTITSEHEPKGGLVPLGNFLHAVPTPGSSPTDEERSRVAGFMDVVFEVRAATSNEPRIGTLVILTTQSGIEWKRYYREDETHQVYENPSSLRLLMSQRTYFRDLVLEKFYPKKHMTWRYNNQEDDFIVQAIDER